jgi:hydrogenase maturation protein HypF
MKCFHLSLKGLVQGVGFRPFVYNLARDLGIKGYIKNTSDGVVIEAEGSSYAEFLDAIRLRYPPLARIDNINVQELPGKGYSEFTIISSSEGASFTLVSPDVSICAACLEELFDPSDRRYLYPFINCTNCGPRYSITKQVPYDRPNTTMSLFKMCPQCLGEYNDPRDRRFHAQPNACSLCGPSVSLSIRNSQFQSCTAENPIASAVELLKRGAVVAVKGLGGFHICCDASNEAAVKSLREKKRKSNKPFALMSPDLDAVRKFCLVSEKEENILKDRRRPIVLLKKKGGNGTGGRKLSQHIAPNNRYLGVMLPYTPLHYLLFHIPDANDPSTVPCHFDALVMTSGNIAEEPIVVDNDEAVAKLSDLADAFLFHDRDIFMRVDDSVVRTGNKREVPLFFLRRARGFVPEPVILKDDGPDVLGCGADLKNCFTITRGNYAVIGQHIGDMENLESLHFFEETLENLKQVYRSQPIGLAYDLHPGYMSSRWAAEQMRLRKVPGYAVQHHYAHIASVMAEHGLKDRVIGIAMDGTGYGTDGNLWGGEFLICDIREFVRAAHFNYIPLPGGERAIKECWRTAVGMVVSAFACNEYNQARLNESVMRALDEAGFLVKYGIRRVEAIVKIAGNRQFSPLSSGAGRVFDAVSALAGVCDVNTFEGEAAIALENEVEAGIVESYAFALAEGGPMRIDFSPAVIQIMDDLKNGGPRGRIAAKFHNTIVEAITAVALRMSNDYGLGKVVLSGGVFQNNYIFDRTYDALTTRGLNVFTNVKVPCNDACISLGQAFLLRERLKEGLPLQD